MSPLSRGRQLFQIPGSSDLTNEIQRALAQSLTDHSGPVFADLVLFPPSGIGAWEAALVNTLSPGELVVGFAQRHFAHTWHRLAQRLGLRVEVLATDPRVNEHLAGRYGENRGR